MKLKARNDIHLARRLYHFLGVMTIFSLYYVLSPTAARTLALSFSLFFISLDFARLHYGRLNQILIRWFQPFMRTHELNKISGSSSLFAGVTLIVFLFPRNVVMLTLLFLAIADPLASYFGIRYGRDKLVGHKSLQGSTAAFVACMIITLAYCLTFGLMTERLFMVTLLAGLIGAASELIPIGRLDDNLVFPVVSATLLTGLFYVFGGI